MIESKTKTRRLRYTVERWPLVERFAIATHVYDALDILYVEIEEDGHVGRGEAAGVDYLDDTPQRACLQAETVRERVERGLDREDLLLALPAGAARNAIDCALWDLQCKRSGDSIWSVLSIEPKPLPTVATIGIGSAAWMADKAVSLSNFDLLKLKLNADDPIGRVQAVRQARPDALLSVDVNTGWSLAELTRYAPLLAEQRVVLIEQPLLPDADHLLAVGASPVPLAADESCQTEADLARLFGRYQFVNIKLDKCGGLTAGLLLAQRARDLGFEIMVGNMLGTSLAMAPAFALAAGATFVDLDGPLQLVRDRADPMTFASGRVQPPLRALWG